MEAAFSCSCTLSAFRYPATSPQPPILPNFTKVCWGQACDLAHPPCIHPPIAACYRYTCLCCHALWLCIVKEYCSLASLPSSCCCLSLHLGLILVVLPSLVPWTAPTSSRVLLRSAVVVCRELEGMLSDRHEDITSLHNQLSSSRSRYKACLLMQQQSAFFKS